MKTLYVIVNKDLKMSKGKACAQVAHAVAKLGPTLADFANEVPNRVVVLEASYIQMLNLQKYLDEADVLFVAYIDEGSHETPPFSLTAMAVQPSNGDDEYQSLFWDLDLYGGGWW